MTPDDERARPPRPEEPTAGRSRDAYTPRQVARLEKLLRREARECAVGRCICPYCKHLEARWRAAADREDPSVMIVRVRCSQCRLQAVLRLE